MLEERRFLLDDIVFINISANGAILMKCINDNHFKVVTLSNTNSIQLLRDISGVLPEPGFQAFHQLDTTQQRLIFVFEPQKFH